MENVEQGKLCSMSLLGVGSRVTINFLYIRF